MKTEYTDVRINSKLAEADYLRLKEICAQYGFKSVYNLVQTLIQVLLRTVDKDKDSQFVEGVPVELTEIVTNALNAQKRAALKSAKR